MPPVDNAYVYSVHLMGSPILLKLFTHDETAVRQVFQRIKQLEDLLTVNRAQSEVMSINHAAGKAFVSVSPLVFALIKRAKAVSLIENSCFNVAIGPVVKLWKIGFSGNAVPDQESIQQALALTRPERIILREQDCGVLLKNAGMEIDLGAIAKGYIADIVRDVLNQHAIQDALINLGGNVLAIGSALTDEHGLWSVGLQKPFADRDSLLGVIKVKNQSVVTSGVYERFFTVGDRIYHHILDPLTGYPLDNELHSVTIISNDSLDGDIYTTLLYGMGVSAGIEFLQYQPDIEAIFVTKNKEIIFSSQRNYKFELLDKDYSVTVL
ncbi:FAD:protein FMN transferase [Pectobacterium wasabiae]|uniref:FAD:protein FMN transferase n=1 Tax=Pectobacterium wasabiae TaxID=55208 RepID=A0AAW3EIV5_9GAMM|nr:FAD:protein FMN transferase [Pectobacterium wasabiae]AOR65595.1 thiamine biosynthesis protein ApbE [Pectobacterium wasabiae CFBP 3304]EJS94088.1 ApbE [Pectobacterium wasabiae CFBP 3304]KFX05666.1 thiamine biosynthesis protein ApbE [Pectobacterium wasabiae]KGA30520.1 thiamine biosynthesis protein ApbE [Pectobacterium wasabiae]